MTIAMTTKMRTVQGDCVVFMIRLTMVLMLMMIEMNIMIMKMTIYDNDNRQLR